MAAQERHQARAPHRAARHITSTYGAPDSDKDSGFSDVASECLSSVEHTDSEEAPPTSRWNPPGCPQSPHPPLLFFKNLLVDQGSGPDPHTHSWTVHPSFQLLPTSSQILLVPPSVTPSKPQPSRKKSSKYIPILNSYPKIAPYPSQQPAQGNKREAKSWHQNQAKRHLQGPSCSSASEKVSTIAGEINVPEEGLLDEALICPAQASTPLQTDNRDRLGTGGSKVRAAPRSDTSHKTEMSALPHQQNKNRRFQNTLEVLNRSGLLSIAIKMKELARLNQATQRQLEKLQEQVRLYAKAIGTNCPEDWKKLHGLLTEGNGPIKELRM